VVSADLDRDKQRLNALWRRFGIAWLEPLGKTSCSRSTDGGFSLLIDQVRNSAKAGVA
jgi:hypothetical protein